MNKHVPCFFHAFPVLVAIHDVESSDHVGKPGSGLVQFRLKSGHILDAGAGRGVATVEKSVNQSRNTFALRHFKKSKKMVDVTVHTAVGEQTAEMYAASAGTNLFEHVEKYGILEKFTAFHGHVDAGHVLIYDAARADIQMSHFRVADESGRQSDLSSRGIQASHAGHGKQTIECGRMSEAGGISRSGRSQTVAVENEKKCGFHCRHQLFSFPSAAVAGSSSAPDQRASRRYSSLTGS